ncbi:MAG: hypothetical protein AYK18_07095 [Theionarchaea archaeon DG-70]|nr:MAG: hypothetical protein AYK18_07095 [Theionarchaea archaeon DG-70]
MPKTGIEEYDSLPNPPIVLDIDAVRATWVLTENPSLIERVFSFLGFEGLSQVLKRRREKKHRNADRELKAQVAAHNVRTQAEVMVIWI